MGYSTNVRMVVRGPRELILREFANLRLSGDKFMQEALDEWLVAEDDPIQYRPNPGDDTQLIPAAVAILGKGGTDWKWYEQYPDVQAHIRIYRHFEELYSSTDSGSDDDAAFLEGAYVRIGEEDNDTQSEDFGEDGCGLARPVRKVECPYDDLDKPDLRPRLAQTAA